LGLLPATGRQPADDVSRPGDAVQYPAQTISIASETNMYFNNIRSHYIDLRNPPAISIDLVALLGTLEMLENASPDSAINRDSTPPCPKTS
jgi:hypothetical protein